MELIMEHWLSMAVGIYLVAMVLYGHYRGFLRMAVSLGALAISIVTVRVAMPHVTVFLKENTGIHTMVRQSVMKAAQEMGPESGWLEEVQLPAAQRQIIEGLQLPQSLKDALIENNNREIYQMLGVDTFFDYIASYLADRVLNLAATILLFVMVFVGLRVLVRCLDLVSRLPVIHGLNQIAGAILGGCQGLLYLWTACLVTDLCYRAAWSQAIHAQIQGSLWLTFLYRHNLLSWMFFRILEHVH